MAAKLMAVSLTIGSGGSGGVSAPSLFLGAMLGGAFGHFAHLALPGLPGRDINSFAIAGMAAVFAGAAQAPITAIMILFELTSDYTVTLPLMLTVVTATVASHALTSETMYTLKLVRRGIDIVAGRDANIMRRLRVRAAMETNPQTVDPDMTIREFVELMSAAHRLSFPVVEADGTLLGMARAEGVEESVLTDEPRLVRETYAETCVRARPAQLDANRTSTPASVPGMTPEGWRIEGSSLH